VNLYRPTWKGPDGTRRRGKVWWMEAKVAGRRHRKSLGVRDKHAAQAMATEIVRRLELQAAGMPVSEKAADTDVKGLIDAYEEELVRRRSSPQHVARTILRIRQVLEKARRLSDVTPETIRKALARTKARGLSPQTQNAYRTAAHGFFAWLVREEKLDENPVSRVARVREGEPSRTRRALTQEELQRLVDAAPPHRGVCYLLAATTGLRRSELASLAWEDVDLEAATIRVRADHAKNRKTAVLPLPEGTVAALEGLRGDPQLPAAKVLRAVPNTATLRKDLKTARIPVETPAGVIDVHALRVTYGTLLARAGVSLAQAQKLMRHSTPALTANVYTKLEMDDAREAVGRIDVYGRKGKERRRKPRVAGAR